jgi:hypothetical protein
MIPVVQLELPGFSARTISDQLTGTQTASASSSFFLISSGVDCRDFELIDVFRSEFGGWDAEISNPGRSTSFLHLADIRDHKEYIAEYSNVKLNIH